MSKRDELQLCADHQRPTRKFTKERPHSLKGGQREEVRVRTLIKERLGSKFNTANFSHVIRIKCLNILWSSFPICKMGKTLTVFSRGSYRKEIGQ